MQCYELLNNKNDDLDYFKNLGWTINQFQTQLSKVNNYALGLYFKNYLEGYIIGDLVISNNTIEYEVLIIYVNILKRNKGYASELLDSIPLVIKEKKLDKIYLEVASNNEKAIKLYEKNQYKRVGIRKQYYLLKHKRIDGYIFEKKINEKL